MPIPKIVVTAALMAANMALTMTRKIEGPRLDDLKFTGGDYGGPLAMVWGMRRLQVPIFWAENLTEVKRRRKTKGGKYNDYSYYGTWAVALAGHEIEAVRKIWFDTHLVYDLSGSGPVTPFDFGSTGDIGDHIAIYLGTETQTADPRIEATVEAEFGEGSCPAYRGTAYIVFKDIPLEKLGNRIPQVSVEIVGNATASFPMQSVTLGTSMNHAAFSPDFTTVLCHNFLEYAAVDVASRAEIVTGELNPDGSSLSFGYAFLSDGSIKYINHADNDVYSLPLGGAASLSVPLAGTVEGTIISVVDGDGDDHWMARSGTDSFYFDATLIDMNGVIGADFEESMPLTDTDGDVWVVGHTPASEVVFYRAHGSNGGGPSIVTVTGLPSHTGGDLAYAFHYSDASEDHFVLAWEDTLYAVSRADGSVVATYAPAYPAGLRLNSFRNIAVGATTFWAGFEEINSADLTRVRLLDKSDWDGGLDQHDLTIYDPVNHALIEVTGDLVIRWFYLDRVSSAGVTLATICGDVAGDCNVEDYDFSDLTQTIPGWSATRGPASNMIEPLLDAYDSDFRPHDFTIQGLKRTGIASGGTLEAEWFAGDPRYSVKVRQASELPRALLIDFADTAAEQQPNSVRADRPLDATDARGEQKIDLTTLALDTDTARQLANRYFRRIWNERKEVSLALTAKELKLEPGDVRTLELDGDEADYRCTRVTIQADDKLATEWKYDHASLASLDGSTGATFDGRDEQTVNVPVLSKGFVLDIPLLSDGDDASVPQVYTMAGPYADGSWPGAIVYQAVDGEYSEELASVPSSSAATWGYVSAAMPYANPNLWDRGTEITVTLQTGELTGCTEAAANADPTLNLAAIGTDGRWEIVQFTTATLTSGTTYTVSGFKRGRRGTEWAAEMHAAGDQFVLLDTADNQAMGLSEVGTDVDFKAITAGRTTGFPFGYSYTGASLKPYAPCHLQAVKESNGDWTLSWVRRTRVGGGWTSGTSIPLSEDSEEYELDLSDGVDTVTKTVTAATTYTWTQAAQVTDVGGEVMAGDLEWAVAQISADVDRGFLAEATA